jgi:DNA polymerase alpha subunit A
MASLLGEVDVNVPAPRLPVHTRTVKSEARRKVRVLSPPVSEAKRMPSAKSNGGTDGTNLLDTPPLERFDDDDDGFLRGMDDDDVPMSDPLPSSPIIKAMERKGQSSLKQEEVDDDDDVMEVSQVVGHHDMAPVSINKSGARPVPKAKKIAYPSPESSSPTRPSSDAVDASAWNEVTSKLNVLSSPASETVSFGKVKPEDTLEEDGSLRMFWLDYTEVNGSLCLFGKVKNKRTGNYVSAFVKVDNILRKLYFLPREHRQRKAES